MSGRDVNKVQLGYYRAEHTETISSPHTYAYGHGGAGAQVPATTLPDMPVVSNISLRSAVAGLSAEMLAKLAPRHAPVTRVKKEEDATANEEEGIGNNDDEEEENEKERIRAASAPASTRRVETMSFDLSGISPPIANTFRRLIMTEVPTLAFDRILIEENDSVVVDELLSHRIGLVPVAGPVAKMAYITESQQAGFDHLDPTRLLVFDLVAEGAKDVPVTPVYSRALRWVPLPGQESWAQSESDEDRVFLVHPDILLTKLGPYQKLKLRAIAVKGLGAVHAKWSAVSACFYQMQTSITFTEPIVGDDAETLLRISPPGVFERDGKTGQIVVRDASKYTLDRECLRQDAYPSLASKIRIEKDKTRVRFHLESVGQMHAAQIFRVALTLFAERCRTLAQLIQSTEVNIVDQPGKAL